MPNETDKDVKGGKPNASEDKTKNEQQNEKVETETETDKEEEGQDEEPAKKSAEYLEKLKEENVKRRQENKALKEKLERQEKALAILQGKDKPDLDPLEAAKSAADAKLRNAILKGELAVVARDAHDPSDLMQLGSKLLKDVEVDVDTESVDRDQLEAAVAKLRKQKPFLFKTSVVDPDTNSEKKKGAPLPKDGGQPTGGKNFLAQWKQLKEQGRTAEAQEYYKKNRAEIMAQMK